MQTAETRPVIEQVPGDANVEVRAKFLFADLDASRIMRQGLLHIMVEGEVARCASASMQRRSRSAAFSKIRRASAYSPA